ncbi:MAG: hypothetical protein NZ571_16280, partial [Anaerolineae bacterium]|nr:hypothetical protein [Anaerolineae bacterium]
MNTLVKRLGQALLVAWALLALVPVANAIRVVREYAVNHLTLEEWYSMAPIAIAIHDGTFSLSQLFEPVNEHLFVLTKLVLALHTGLTHFNQTFGQHLNLLLSLLIWSGVLGLLWSQDRLAALLAAPLLSLSVLNVRQAFNWLMATQSAFLFPVLAILIIVTVFQRMPISWRALLSAMAVAFL